MNRDANILDEAKIEGNSFCVADSTLETQEFLLFIAECSSTRLKALNLRAKNFYHEEADPSGQGENFFDQAVHPGDLADFTEVLRSCEKKLPSHEQQIRLRLKTPEGRWQIFLFQVRPYLNTRFFHEEHALLIGRELQADTPVPNSVPINPKMRELLAESQSRYQSLVNSIDQGFASLDMIYDLSDQPIDYLYVETNPGIENHVDFQRPEGKTIGELCPNLEDSWVKTFGKVARNGRPVRFQRFSEELRNSWFDVYAFPIGTEKHRKVGIIFTNITDQKAAEDNLRGMNQSLEKKVEEHGHQLEENARLLQTIFDTTNEGIMVLQPLFNEKGEIRDFLYLRTNRVMEKLQQKQGLEGKPYLKTNPESATNGLFEIFRGVMHTGNFQDFEFAANCRKKKNQWYRITVRKENRLLIVSMEDITLRKLEAERLKENIRFKKELTSTSPDFIMIFNLQKERIRYLNRNLSSHPGLRKEMLTGKNISELFNFIHPREREKLLEFHQKIIEGANDQITETEFRLRGTTKEWEWYNAVGKVFKRGQDGKVEEYLILLRNIEGQKATQKALLQAEKLSIKGEVARTLTHELRNPLASIGMATEVLRSALPEEKQSELENYLSIIDRSSKMLNQLVTDLLTSSNYKRSVLRKTCLSKTLEETLQSANDRIYLSGIKVVRKYNGEYFIKADPEKLKIALLNIIINASEAMDPDRGVLRLKINRKNDLFVLSIRDNGHGLEKDQLNKLFNAFYTQKAGGLGVGLSSVKKILDEHGAEIKVESELGKGTCFHLFFQCHEALEGGRAST